MGSEWAVGRLGDVAEIFDGPHATPKKTSTGPIFLGISSLDQGRLNLSGIEHLSEDEFAKWTRRVTPQPGDVVFSYETRLGAAAMIPEGLRCCLGRRMGLLRILRGKADPRFVLYSYLGPFFQDVIRQRTIHGSTVDRIPLIEMATFPFLLPPIHEQQAIARILGVLDDKIELNRRMNETLEAIARALFKSWFIDFDPVRAKMAGRAPAGMDAATAALFPATLDESGAWPIPTGWTVERVQDVIEALFDGPHATPPESKTGSVFLGIRNFKPASLDLTDVRRISDEDWPRWTKRVTPRTGDIVFTYEATLGYFGMIPSGLRCCLGRRTALIRPSPGNNNRYFLFHWFTAPVFQGFLQAHKNPGSTVDRILLSDFPGYPVLAAPPLLIVRFESLASPLWDRIHAGLAEIATLTELRDLLLPKLLSGELRVRDAERAVEKAL